jgi:hypothetical protein
MKVVQYKAAENSPLYHSSRPQVVPQVVLVLELVPLVDGAILLGVLLQQQPLVVVSVLQQQQQLVVPPLLVVSALQQQQQLVVPPLLVVSALQQQQQLVVPPLLVVSGLLLLAPVYSVLSLIALALVSSIAPAQHYLPTYPSSPVLYPPYPSLQDP